MAITHPLYDEVIAWSTHSGQPPLPAHAMSTTNDMAGPSLTAKPSPTSLRHAAPTASRKSGANGRR